MHWLDWTILALLSVAVVMGAWSGLVKQVFRMVGFALAGYASVALNGWASEQLLNSWLEDTDPRIATPVAYGVVFAVVYFAVFVVSRLVERGAKAAKLQFYNRLFGATLAAGKMTMLLGVVCFGLERLPFPQTREAVEESVMAPVLARGTQEGVKALPPKYQTPVAEGWERVYEKLPAK
jgi:uncharacterized membrane protein required for colicin V production